MTPKPLRKLTDVSATTYYDPEDINKLLTSDLSQDIYVYPAVPLYLMSPRTRVYRAQDVLRFKGYLSSFKPDGVDENEKPEAVVTITTTED